MDLSNVNYLAVIVATIVSFLFGALWYSPVMFSKQWQKYVGLSDQDVATGNMAKIFGTTWILTAVMGLGVALALQNYSDLTLVGGFIKGMLIGLLFVAPSMGINIMYQRKSLALWAIDAGYQVLFLGIMGAILAIW